MFIVASAFFGLIIGSFLGMCAYRVPRRMSVISPARSFCTHCDRELSVKENLPVFSFLIQGGKTACCKEKLSWRYPGSEILSAAACIGCYLFFDDLLTAFAAYLLVAVLVLITVIDLEHKIIPNVINFPGMVIGLAIGGLNTIYPGTLEFPFAMDIYSSLLGWGLGFGLFYSIAWIYFYISKRDGLGGGDIKFLGFIGALLGVEAVLPTMFFGSLSGAVVGVTLMKIKGSGRHTEIPFGPWLCLGVLIHIFVNPPIFRP